jgi:uncharacterized RDD family membrane protein YckC
MESFSEKFTTMVLAGLIVVAIVLVLSWPIQILWNWLSPLYWAGAPHLTWWQTLWSMALLKIIGELLHPHKETKLECK